MMKESETFADNASKKGGGIKVDMPNPPSCMTFDGEQYTLDYVYLSQLMAREAGKKARHEGIITKFRTLEYGYGCCLYVIRK